MNVTCSQIINGLVVPLIFLAAGLFTYASWIRYTLLKQLFQERQAAERLSTQGYKLNTDRTVAVSLDVYFDHDMTKCPRNVKVQLLNEGGVALYGIYRGEPYWTGWCPAPKTRQLPENT